MRLMVLFAMWGLAVHHLNLEQALIVWILGLPIIAVWLYLQDTRPASKPEFNPDDGVVSRVAFLFFAVLWGSILYPDNGVPDDYLIWTWLIGLPFIFFGLFLWSIIESALTSIKWWR